MVSAALGKRNVEILFTCLQILRKAKGWRDMNCPKCDKKVETDGEIGFHTNTKCEDDLKDLLVYDIAEAWELRALTGEAKIGKIRALIDKYNTDSNYSPGELAIEIKLALEDVK